MGRDYKIKLSSVLNLDESKEKDLINKLEELKGSHKLGDFIAICVRACYENPDFFRQAGYDIGTLSDFSGRLTRNRENFFRDIENQMSSLRNKVDKVYDMAFKVYNLAMFNKRLGLEEKSESLLQTAFLLQRQINELSSLFGVTDITRVWESDKLKLEETSKMADDILEYIITVYDGTVNELNTISVKTTGQSSSNTLQNNATGMNVNVGVVGTTLVKESDIKTSEHEEIIEEQPNFDDNADWSALDKFVGLI